MPEATTNSAILAALEIHIEDRRDVRFWAQHFNVKVGTVRQAIETVGPKMIDVRRFLNK